jgi:hypothetical protein
MTSSMHRHQVFLLCQQERVREVAIVTLRLVRWRFCCPSVVNSLSPGWDLPTPPHPVTFRSVRVPDPEFTTRNFSIFRHAVLLKSLRQSVMSASTYTCLPEVNVSCK